MGSGPLSGRRVGLSGATGPAGPEATGAEAAPPSAVPEKLLSRVSYTTAYGRHLLRRGIEARRQGRYRESLLLRRAAFAEFTRAAGLMAPYHGEPLRAARYLEAARLALDLGRARDAARFVRDGLRPEVTGQVRQELMEVRDDADRIEAALEAARFEFTREGKST